MLTPFVPKEYACIECNNFRLWHAQNETKPHIDLIIEAASFALDQLFIKLKYKNKRSIEICLYHSNKQAVSCLDRRIPGNMAMAPYSTDKGSLIILQNSMADPMNGDPQRIRRMLVHEICHLFVREKSGSAVFLGDGLKHLKVRPWVDEGFAEYLSWFCIGKSNPFLKKSFEYIDNLDEVDRLLNDFSSDQRTSAFCTASFLVQLIIEELGLNFLFESMIKLSAIGDLPTLFTYSSIQFERDHSNGGIP